MSRTRPATGNCYVDAFAIDAGSFDEVFQCLLSFIQRLNYPRFSLLDQLSKWCTLFGGDAANQFLAGRDCALLARVTRAQLSQLAGEMLSLLQRQIVRADTSAKGSEALELSFERFASSRNFLRRFSCAFGHFFLTAAHFPENCPAKS